MTVHFRLVWALFFAVCFGHAHAQTDAASPAKKYAVISLIGESLTVTNFRFTTGSHLDTNATEAMPMPDARLDRAVLSAADGAIKKMEPSATVAMMEVLTLRDPAQQKQLFDGERFVPPDDVVLALKTAGATHVLLITKHRAEASFQAEQVSLGSGSVQGLGFYVDHQKRVRLSDTLETGVGFLAPHAFFMVSLIDVGTSRVLKQQAVTRSRLLGVSRNSEDLGPWGILTTQQKVQMLLDFIKRDVPSATQKVMSPS